MSHCFFREFLYSDVFVLRIFTSINIGFLFLFIEETSYRCITRVSIHVVNKYYPSTEDFPSNHIDLKINSS